MTACELSNRDWDIELLKRLYEESDIESYCVCSERGTVVYIAETKEEAEKFIRDIKAPIDLHSVSIKDVP